MIAYFKVMNTSTVKSNTSIPVALIVFGKMYIEIQQTGAHKSWNL